MDGQTGRSTSRPAKFMDRMKEDGMQKVEQQLAVGYALRTETINKAANGTGPGLSLSGNYKTAQAFLLLSPLR